MSAVALDLTPTETTRDLEGFKIPILLFRDGARMGRWQPPADWPHATAGGKLTFRPKDIAQALLEFRILPRKPDELAITPETFTKYAAALLPASFVEPVLTATFPSPFSLGEITTLEFAYTATEFGRPIQASVFLADISAKERLFVFLVARKDDFPAIHNTAVSSLVGWNWEAAK